MQSTRLQLLLAVTALIGLGLLVAGVFYKQNFDQAITFPSLGDLENSLDCSQLDQDNLVVILAVGQSIASNYGSVPYAVGPKVFSFYNGTCFRGNDPLPGADGNGGSIWSRLGDLLIQRGLAKNVLLVAVGSGGSSVSEWVPDAKLYPRLIDAATNLRASGFKPTLVVWLQGSRDRGMEPQKYRKHLRDFIFSFPILGIQLGQPTRMLVATHTRCNSEALPELQAAQRGVVEPDKFIFEGPNMDALDNEMKYDRCHYNEKGLDLAANLWLESISKVLPSTSAIPRMPDRAASTP